MQKKRVIILGVTGSIGRQSCDVAAAYPERFEVVGLSAHRDISGLYKASGRFPDARLALSGFQVPPCDAQPGFGPLLLAKEGLAELITATKADVVVNGIAGAAGLLPSLLSLQSGKDLALANKESVVMGYSLLAAASKKAGKRIVPVDSEHAALFQLLERIGDAEELTITASGGAFRDRPLDELKNVGADEAAAHPSWNMGRKISIDSATMANKGLEVIEASRLFSTPPERVKVLIHPQSIVHALVRGKDGSLYATMSEPDMRLPILNALAYPECLSSPFGRLDLAGKSLSFSAAEEARYPLLFLAYDALASGYGATVAYNAADEVAVAAFEASAIAFLDIARVVEQTLRRSWPRELDSLEAIFETDTVAREAAKSAIKELR